MRPRSQRTKYWVQLAFLDKEISKLLIANKGFIHKEWLPKTNENSIRIPVKLQSLKLNFKYKIFMVHFDVFITVSSQELKIKKTSSMLSLKQYI